MTIYLIRHGKTEANEKHLYCGSTDLPLSEAGKAELQTHHYDIKNVRFITSGMKRTNETLRILFGHVPYVEDPRFREVDFGAFEMHSYEELKDTPVYQAWITGDNNANVPPNGESGEQMKVRVLAAFSEIREDTCIITHGGVIAAIMEYLFPEENKNLYQWQPKPGCGYAVEQHNSKTNKPYTQSYLKICAKRDLRSAQNQSTRTAPQLRKPLNSVRRFSAFGLGHEDIKTTLHTYSHLYLHKSK